MEIREILALKSDEIHSIAPTDLVSDAVVKLVRLGIGSLVVMQDKQMVGFITERDIVQGMVKYGCDLKDAAVSKIMVTEPLATSPQSGSVMSSPTLMLHWPQLRAGIAKAMAKVAMLRAFFFRFMRR